MIILKKQLFSKRVEPFQRNLLYHYILSTQQIRLVTIKFIVKLDISASAELTEDTNIRHADHNTVISIHINIQSTL